MQWGSDQGLSKCTREGKNRPWEWWSLFRDRHLCYFPCQKLWIKLWIKGPKLWITPVKVVNRRSHLPKVVNQWPTWMVGEWLCSLPVWQGPARIHSSWSEFELPSIHTSSPETRKVSKSRNWKVRQCVWRSCAAAKSVRQKHDQFHQVPWLELGVSCKIVSLLPNK